MILSHTASSFSSRRDSSTAGNAARWTLSSLPPPGRTSQISSAVNERIGAMSRVMPERTMCIALWAARRFFEAGGSV